MGRKQLNEPPLPPSSIVPPERKALSCERSNRMRARSGGYRQVCVRLLQRAIRPLRGRAGQGEARPVQKSQSRQSLRRTTVVSEMPPGR